MLDEMREKAVSPDLQSSLTAFDCTVNDGSKCAQPGYNHCAGLPQLCLSPICLAGTVP